VRLAVQRALASPRMAARARALGAWARANDGAERAAELVEEFAARSRGGA
jgi:UDP:flavonoid glycosyltransferase YjiC (YdhE family)